MPYLGKSPSQAVRRRYQYLASASDTSVSGSDANGNTLLFSDGEYVDVYLNGVKLKAGTDYNTDTANTIASLAALAANDEITVVVYDTFGVFSGTFSNDITVGGTANLAAVSVTGAITANAGVNVDNITIDGTEIDLSSGDLTLDVAGDIVLDADGDNITIKDGTNTTLDIVSNGTTDVTLDAPGDIFLDADGGNVTIKDNGTSVLDIANNSTDVELTVSTADKNFKIKGTDGSSAITALDIDMAAAGHATFNNQITATNGNFGSSVSTQGVLNLSNGGAEQIEFFTGASSGVSQIQAFNRNDSSYDSLEMIALDFKVKISGSEKMRINSSGNVGIGETNPDNSIHITSNTPIIRFDESDVSQVYQIGSFGGSFAVYDNTDSVYRMAIDGDGDIGVGTVSPVSKLTVSGQITATGGAVSAPTYSFDNDTNTGMSRPTTDAINFVAGGSEIARVTSAGIHIGGTGSANALDDYEEGTWTPSGPSLGVATTHKAIYRKIGDIVVVYCDITYNASPSDVAQATSLSGLPFSSNDSYTQCNTKVATRNQVIEAEVSSTSVTFRDKADGVIMTRNEFADNRAQHLFIYTIA